MQAKEIQEKDYFENNIKDNEIKEKNMKGITKTSSLKRTETEDKDNKDNNKLWKELFHKKAEKEKYGNTEQENYITDYDNYVNNIGQENYDNVTAYEYYDTNMGQQNYNSITETENYNNIFEDLTYQIPNDNINSLPIPFLTTCVKRLRSILENLLMIILLWRIK